MKPKSIRILAASALLIFAILSFIYYFIKHPEIGNSLKSLNLYYLIILIGLYLLSVPILALIGYFTLAIGHVKIPFKENILLTCYSAVVNFFGPLQSGPGVRIAYLKKQHNVSIKNYLFGTFIYYGFFSLFSSLFLCINVLIWWQTILVIIVIAVLSILLIKHKQNAKFANYSIDAIIKLGLVTLLQVFLVAIIYFVELHIINKGIDFAQVITYTGAANFALFVSLTPGAIGFRESFLLISQHLHHISSSQILAASVIDRSVYVMFLGILFIFSITFHFRNKFYTKKSEQSVSKHLQ